MKPEGFALNGIWSCGAIYLCVCTTKRGFEAHGVTMVTIFKLASFEHGCFMTGGTIGILAATYCNTLFYEL